MGHRCEPKGRRSLIVPVLMIATVIGIALRFVDLGGQSLWVDEMMTIRTAFVGKPMPARDFFSSFQGPLMSLMIHFWAGLSMAEGFLRFPFALAGSVTVLSIYLLSRYLSNSWTALNTAFVASLSPMLIWYSQEVRGYGFVVLFTTLMTYFLMRFAHSGRSRYLVLYGAFLLAGLLSNLSAAFVAAAHLIYLLVYQRRWRRLGMWVLTVFIVLLFFSPWVHIVFLRGHVEGVARGDVGVLNLGGGPFSEMAIAYSLFTYSVGYTLGPPVRDLQTKMDRAVMENLHWAILAAVVFAVPVIVGIRRLVRENPRVLVLLLVWLVVPLVALSVLALRNVRAFTPRYAMVSIPPYVMIVGHGLGVINRSKWRAFTLIFIILLGVSLHNYFFEPAYRKDDARAAARTISERLEEDDTVVALYAVAPLTHYLEGCVDVQVFEADDMETHRTMGRRCEQIAEGSERVWLSLCREWRVDPEGIIQHWFDSNMVLVRSFEFPGFRLYLYHKEAGQD